MTPTEADSTLDDARRALDAGDVDGAKTRVEAVLAALPGHAAAQLLLGVCLAPQPARWVESEPEAADHQGLAVRTAWNGNALVLTWEWPPEYQDVLVAVVPDDASVTQAEAMAGATPVTRSGYEARGFFMVPRVHSRARHWIYLLTSDGTATLAACPVAVPIAPILWGVCVERNFWRTVTKRVIEFRSAEVEALSAVRVVRAPDRVPLRPTEGQLVEEVSRLEFRGGVASIALPLKSTGELLNVFPGEADRAKGIWFQARPKRGTDSV